MSSQPLLVTDTNIWIDVYNGNLLLETFRLPYRFLIPDLSIPEFVCLSWHELELLGLNPYVLGPSLIQQLYDFRYQYRNLSMRDLAAFILARDLNAVLLTGDRRLRALAEAHGVEVHGVLWILDQLIHRQILEPGAACERLERICAMGARLPVGECERRLIRWRSSV
ncbi:MAG: PIN domain-containing protein [Chloroflexi bacterium]|jgi:hypothetical protein|nr:PIN domain-containing protein [Chloroflexota bacterium]